MLLSDSRVARSVQRGGRWLLCATILCCLLACGPKRAPELLPHESEVEPDKLLIFVHGYLSSATPMTAYVDQFARLGVPTFDDSGAWETRKRYHVHAFDYGHFSRPGSDQNVGVEELASAFAEFYHGLPDSCPVCQRRKRRPVQVTLIGHSLGGVVLREFLLDEAEREFTLVQQTPGATHEPSTWAVDRVITTGTPYFGSSLTRLTHGFLSVVLNGLVRTAVMGFVRPDAAGVFGNTIDAQAQALRLGSPYLWGAQERWKVLEARLKERGRALPHWLAIVAVGNARPEDAGDGVVRFSAANLAPLFPDQPMETLVVNLDHRRMVRIKKRGQELREQRQMVATMNLFIERGTLSTAPPNMLVRFALTVDKAGDHLAEDEGDEESDDTTLVRQRFFLPAPDPHDPVELRDFRQRLQRVKRVVAFDAGDVWLRFYSGLPTSETPPRVLALKYPLSFFQNGVERSRDWTDRVYELQPSADGEEIPRVAALAPERSHLISIPDLRPAGPYRLWIRLDHGVELTPEDVQVQVDAGSAMLPWQDTTVKGIPLWIRPQQPNLVHVYLDRERILKRYPLLKRLVIREVSLEPEEKPLRLRQRMEERRQERRKQRQERRGRILSLNLKPQPF